jgi:hypothetical protein
MTYLMMQPDLSTSGGAVSWREAGLKGTCLETSPLFCCCSYLRRGDGCGCGDVEVRVKMLKVRVTVPRETAMVNLVSLG